MHMSCVVGFTFVSYPMIPTASCELPFANEKSSAMGSEKDYIKVGGKRGREVLSLGFFHRTYWPVDISTSSQDVFSLLLRLD